MFVLDTNVISEYRKILAGKADQNVARWSAQVAAETLYLSAISILELEMGVLLLERKDAPQSAILRHWLEQAVVPAFQGRILPVDTKVALVCARLHVPDFRAERDALIAATALASGMIVVTRNTSDFQAMGVTLLNPWLPATKRD
jgi:predicted nucleic acid-binding protein